MPTEVRAARLPQWPPSAERSMSPRGIRTARCPPPGTNAAGSAVPSSQTGAVDDDLRALRDACGRALTGHGVQRADDLLATIPPGTAVDRYGEGGVVAELEAEVAGVLGLPAAVYLPSGTMAQQAVLRVHAGPARAEHRRLPSREPPRPARGPGAGTAARAGRPARGRPAPAPRAGPTSPRVAEAPAALVLELPQRDLGGQLPTWDELRAADRLGPRARRGRAPRRARLWEALGRLRHDRRPRSPRCSTPPT